MVVITLTPCIAFKFVKDYGFSSVKLKGYDPSQGNFTQADASSYYPLPFGEWDEGLNRATDYSGDPLQSQLANRERNKSIYYTALAKKILGVLLGLFCISAIFARFGRIPKF